MNHAYPCYVSTLCSPNIDEKDVLIHFEHILTLEEKEEKQMFRSSDHSGPERPSR